MCRICASSEHFTTFATDASGAIRPSAWYVPQPRVWASATSDTTASITATSGTATGGPVLAAPTSLIAPASLDAPASLNTPAFDIVVSFTGDQQFLEYFTAAARLWELVITGDLPSDNVSPPTGPGLIDDLYIDASAIPMDGPYGTLGSAGPTWLRFDSLLPSTGVMEFDSADLARLATEGTLQAVIMHEMGHVLGIGTIWDPGTLNLVTEGPNYTYGGAAALAEYRLLSNNAGAASVPVETDGGEGTAGGHWDDDLFGDELMTGYITSSSAPLSRMSIAALRDMGYTVDLGYADPYWLAATPAALRDDVSGNYNSTATIAIGSTSTGVIELDEDNDWFRVNLTGGTTYTFEMGGAPSGGGTLMDAMLRLRAADGEILAFNDNATTSDSRFVFTVATTGQFYLDAAAAGSQTGSYTLSVEIGTPPLFTTADDTISLPTAGQSWDALAGNDAVTGTTGNDTINGNAGNDTLTGGGGVDHLTGGAGDDVFYVDSANDLVLEAVAGGTDMVFSTTTYTLAANSHVETLRTTNATGATVINFTGNALANTLIGNAAGNILSGGDSADILSGLDGNDTLIGGTGADRLVGGLGNDAYYVDTSADIVLESTGQGTDAIFTTLSYSLNVTAEIEVLRTTSLTGLTAIHLTGNSLTNTLIGNAAGNRLSGGASLDYLYGNDGNDTLDGGSDGDRLNGGKGNDIFYVDATTDVLYELVGEGTDTVYTSVSFTLSNVMELEVLRATNPAATGLTLTGNALANTIIGSSGTNTLSGADGDDALSGLAGNDTLLGGNGTDRLLGGLGNDQLSGGAGADRFLFDTTPSNSGNADVITDFAVSVDQIWVARSVFTAFAATGALAASAFTAGPAATTTAHRIMYDPLTGSVSYDADGVGGATAVQFATIAPSVALTSQSFWIY